MKPGTAPLPEVWLRGPLPDVIPVLQPAAHALLQSAEDIERAAASLTIDELWTRPGGAASAAFHLRHIAGSIDRLLTYARGEQLDEVQRKALAAEGEPGDPLADAHALAHQATSSIGRALDAIRAATSDSIAEPRAVGRANLPSTLSGLLFHIAEHTQRHTGQLITTGKIVRGLGLASKVKRGSGQLP
jgi:uncharacterized damage-inducible protein DinB